MEEFAVGPLPLSNSTTAQPLSFFSNRQKGSKVRVHDADFATDGALSKTFLTEAADVLKILWNVVRSLLQTFLAIHSVAFLLTYLLHARLPMVSSSSLLRPCRLRTVK